MEDPQNNHGSESDQNSMNTTQSQTDEGKSNKKVFVVIGCVLLLLVLSVCGGVVVFGGTVLTSLDPSGAMDEARYTVAKQDVDAMYSGLRQYVIRDLDGQYVDLSVECVNGQALPVINSLDGLDPTEGGDVNSLSACLASYISVIPTPPDGFVYRWGVDSAVNPTTVYVGATVTDSADEDSAPDYIQGDSYYQPEDSGSY